MKTKFARLYDKCQEDQRKVLIDLDHALADHSNELQKLRKYNKKIERNYLPEEGTMLSEIVKLAAEIEMMTIKKEDVGEAL